MKRVTGIGGIFFKAKDAPALLAWYKRHLGIDVQDWGGAAFTWTELPAQRALQVPSSGRLDRLRFRISMHSPDDNLHKAAIQRGDVGSVSGSFERGLK